MSAGVYSGAMAARPGIEIGSRRLIALVGEVDGGPYYRALAERVRLLVVDGRVPVGSRLPSERELALALGRSRSTVVAAYQVLREGGYLHSRQGSGSIVALPAQPIAARPVDLAHAVPPPIEGLAGYVARALADPRRIVDAPCFDLVGDEGLRAAIAARYAELGLPTSPDQVLVTNGAQHAIGLVVRALLRPGDRVLTECPSYPHAAEAVRAAGGRIVTTPVGRDGWDLEHLVGMLDRYRPALAYLMPDFQNPTGASMPAADRAAVAGAAARAGTTLIVDETTADLDIDRGWREPPFAHLAQRSGADVVTIGSLSKSLWGGLRLGWVRAGRAHLDAVVRRRPAVDMGTARLDQLVAAELVPDLATLLPLRAAQLRRHRDHLLEAVRAALPEWECPAPDGGLSLWVALGHPVATSLAVLSRTRGLELSAGPQFSLDGSLERYLRLPYTAPLDELSRGVAVLREAWETLDRTGVRPAPAWGSVV